MSVYLFSVYLFVNVFIVYLFICLSGYLFICLDERRPQKRVVISFESQEK